MPRITADDLAARTKIKPGVACMLKVDIDGFMKGETVTFVGADRYNGGESMTVRVYHGKETSRVDFRMGEFVDDYLVDVATLTKLDEDTDEDAASARRGGWRIDGDLWWVRPIRGTDPRIDDAAVGFTCSSSAFVRTAALALGYDQGRTTR